MSQVPLIADGPNLKPEVSPQTEPTGGGLSLPTISTRQLVLIAAILLLGFLIWRARRSRSPKDDESRDIIQDDAIEGIYVPENPDDPLRADSAVIAGLKEAGVMG